MSVGTAEGQIVGIKPVLDAPVNRGHLCVKGRYAFDFISAPDRVSRPHVHDRGDDWRAVSWGEAISFAATELTRIRSRYGADSIGVLGSARATNEENYLI